MLYDQLWVSQENRLGYILPVWSYHIKTGNSGSLSPRFPNILGLKWPWIFEILRRKSNNKVVIDAHTMNLCAKNFYESWIGFSLDTNLFGISC